MGGALHKDKKFELFVRHEAYLVRDTRRRERKNDLERLLKIESRQNLIETRLKSLALLEKRSAYVMKNFGK